MLARLTAAIEALRGGGGDGGAAAAPLDAARLATAVLLVNAASFDGRLDAREQAAVTRLLTERFALTPQAAAALFAEARQEAGRSIDLYGVTRTIRRELDHAARLRLIEMMWEVVYADGELHDYEASLMRRVVGLIHIDDRESGAARRRARAKLGLAAGSDLL